MTLLSLTGLCGQLPEATLAAVVIAAVIELVDVPALRRLYRVWTERLGGIHGPAARADFLAAAAGMLDQLTRELAARDVPHHAENDSGVVIYRDVDAAVTAARMQSRTPDN